MTHSEIVASDVREFLQISRLCAGLRTLAGGYVQLFVAMLPHQQPPPCGALQCSCRSCKVQPQAT